MALFIRDAEIDALAEEYRKLAKVKTKAEAVRLALKMQLAQTRRALAIGERLAHAKALADAMGPSDRAFDMKSYTDQMWSDA